MYVHEAGSKSHSSELRRQQKANAMAGVFDIDLDQPEENVSDDELDDVSAFINVAVTC